MTPESYGFSKLFFQGEGGLRGFQADGCLGRSIKIPMEQIARSRSPRVSISFAFLFSNQHVCFFFGGFSMFFTTFTMPKWGIFEVLRLVGFDTMLWSQPRHLVTFQPLCAQRCVNVVTSSLPGLLAKWQI